MVSSIKRLKVSALICSGLLLIANSALANPRQIGSQDGTESLTRFEYREIHMGVAVRLVVYAPSETVAQSACEAAFNRFADLEQVMSDYRPSSELMKLCAKAGGPPVKVSKDLFEVLKLANEFSKKSDGAFDITVGPLVHLWREARKSGALPDMKEIEKAKALTGWRNVVLNAKQGTVKLLIPGMKLDLGGIGKGFGDDEAQKVLKKYGIRSALVEAGGDIVVSDPPPGKAGWKVEVANRSNIKGEEMPESFMIHNCAMSTSGDTFQFVEIGGKRYSHIVDPHTGMGLTTRVAVTVIAPRGSISDPLTKGVSILPLDKAHALAHSVPGVKAWIRHLPLGPPEKPAGTATPPEDRPIL